MSKFYTTLNADILKKAYHLMCMAREMDRICERHAARLPYPHSHARGHEAIQIALALQLKPHDFLFPYYRDEALLLGVGLRPYELLLQLLACKDDPFTGGKRPYCSPVLHREDLPEMPVAGTGDGGHVVAGTGLAQGLMHLVSQNLRMDFDRPAVVCSLGDAAALRGDLAESLQMAALKRLPVVYLVQDNDWAGTAKSDTIRTGDAYDLAGGFRGMKRVRINGADFVDAYDKVQVALDYVRTERMPVLLHAKCPLLGHHDARTRREDYRDEADLALHRRDEPLDRLRRYLAIEGETEEVMAELEAQAARTVEADFAAAEACAGPDAGNVMLYRFAPARLAPETGNRNEAGQEPPVSFREAGVEALRELLEQHPEALCAGREAGSLRGGACGETAGLAAAFGPDRVASTPPTEAYLVGACAGLAAAGCRPIVSLPAAGLPAALDQLNRLSESSYLSNGRCPVPAVIRVLVGEVGVESLLTPLKGLKIACPATAADLKGLLKAAYADPNPVVVLEHTGLYELPAAASPEPDAAYHLPLGKARTVLAAGAEARAEGRSLVVVTYGPGVHWAVAAAAEHAGAVEVLDLRTLHPLDWEAVVEAVKRHGKALVLSSEPQRGSFSEMLAGRIMQQCFRLLDAPVLTCGSASLPAVPLNRRLAEAALANTARVSECIGQVLGY